MNQPIKGMAKWYPLCSINPAQRARSIKTDRMNLLFTMTNNRRHSHALAHMKLKLFSSGRGKVESE
jgi:hypothetical protein